MAEIDYKYKDELHKISTYDDVLKTYHWISNAIYNTFEDRKELSIRCNIAFSSDEMSYECRSIDEFKKYAFGKSIKIKHLSIHVTENWNNSLVDVFAIYSKYEEKQEFIISSSDEMWIINLRDALLLNNDTEPQHKETIVMKYEDNSIHIGNNNQISNSVVGSKNKTDVEQRTEILQEKKESFLSKTFWQIIIPIIVAAIVAWLGLK